MPPEPFSKHGLHAHEWVILCSCMAALITIVAVSFAQKTPFSQKEGITVFVTGAVAESKEVLVPAGACLIDLLSAIALHPDANVEKLFLESPLHPNQVVVIPKSGYVSVFVSGAVAQKGVVLLPEGSRFPDLVRHAPLLKTADRAWICRKKRLLKDGEHVCIPQIISRTKSLAN